MKIKTKKQLNLSQLIDYIWDNDIKNECFRRLNRGPFEYVWVNEDSNIEFDDYMLFRKNDIFEIEIEEVVDEDTKLPKSLAIFEHNGNLYSEMHSNKNINDILKMDIKIKSSSTKTIHMVNDDGTHTLIWRDGKLVE